MQEYITIINDFISTHQAWAGIITALLCFGESLLIIGLVIPATAILIFTGALLGAGTLEPMPILVGGIAGAIVGDAVSYYIGRWLGWDITQKAALRNYRRFFIRTRLFFKKYGTLSVFLGRFMGPIRSTIPTVAGIMGLNHTKFQIANITSAILWMPIMLSPGYFSAKGAKSLAEHSGSGIGTIFSLLSIALGIALVLFFIIPRKKRPSRP